MELHQSWDSLKANPKKCLNCHAEWISHEEKETDVNLALALLDLAVSRSL